MGTRTLATAVVAGLTLGFAGCNSDDPKPAQRSASPKFVHGWAYAGGPISDARIRVLTTGGKEIADRPAATEKGGTFYIRVRNLPADYRVVVTGGRDGGRPFKGELRTEVRRDSGAAVHLSPVSTVVSHHLASHPAGGPEAAEDRVMRQLQVPAGIDAEDLRLGNRFFSGRAFVREARRREGGINELTRKVASDAGAKGTPHPYGDTNPIPITSGGPAEDFLKSLIDSAAEKLKDEAAGWVLAQLGIGGSGLTDAELVKINAQLAAISQQLTEIKAQLGEISADLKQLGYDQIVDGLPLSKIDHVQGELKWLAEHPKSTDRQSVIETLVGTSSRAGYIESNLQDVADSFNRAYTGGFDRTKLVDAYGQVALKKSPTLPMFTPKDSQRIFAAYAYYDLYLLQGLDAVVEWKHSRGEKDRPKDLILDVARKRKDVYDKTLPSKLPAEGVVDSRSSLMWRNVFGRGYFGGTSNAVAGLNRTAANGFKNWTLPSMAQLQSVIIDRGGKRV